MPGIGYGIGHIFNKIFLPSSLILWLDATFGKTIATGVSIWLDKTRKHNNATQGTGANQPVDNTTYLHFDANDNMDCGSIPRLNNPQNLTLYARAAFLSDVAFASLIHKFTGGTGGFVLCSSSAGDGYKARLSTELFKQALDINSTTKVTSAGIKEIKATFECTRKFGNKQQICLGEEPQIYKENGVYYLIYSRYTGVQYNVYLRSSTSHLFADSSETLLISGANYPSIMKDGSTYRIVATSDPGTNHNMGLWTSSSISSGYISQGTVITFGAAYDANQIADAHEIKIGATYYIYYTGFSTSTAATICYATSATGAAGSYTKQGTCLSNGGAGTFDLHLCADPDIQLLPDNVTYIMFYSGVNNTRTKTMQGYATSADGITWTKFSGNPIHYFSDPSFEAGSYGPNEMTALYENGTWRMWYRAKNDAPAENNLIGYFNFLANPTTYLPICGNESITLKMYINGSLETTVTNATPIDSLDYLKSSGTNLKVGSVFGTGDTDIYEIKVNDSIV